jgi:hypothetical protein
MEPEKHLAPSRRVARRGRSESFHAPLLRYLFGPTPTLVVDPEALLVEIDRLGGVVVPADIIRVTGMKRAAAESVLCKLAGRHGGDVTVHGEAVLYRFPRLTTGLPRLISSGRTPRPVWEHPRLPDAITGNRPSIDRWLVLANLIILIGAATAAIRTLSASAWQPALAMLFFALGLAALAMPVMRLVRRRAHLAEIAAENGRRAIVRAVLQRRIGSTIGAHALSHAWVAAAGRAVRQSRLFDEVTALGGEPDIDGHARIHFRFPDLDYEARALTNLRPASPRAA